MERSPQKQLAHTAWSGKGAAPGEHPKRPKRGGACLCAFLLGGALLVAGCATVQWQVSRTFDPITDETRCVVASYDQGGLLSFSRVGYLYPVVEVHPTHGLLVGAGSGGMIEVPVGDVVWRVDQNPHHEIKVANSPVDKAFASSVPDLSGTAVSEEHRAALESATQAMGSLFSGATLATGTQARAILEEMKAGSSLLFRRVVSDTGLPTSAVYQVGQYSGGKQEPIPLDESFLAALADCGIE